MYRLSRDGPLLRRMRLGQSPVVPVQIRWIAASQATIAEALFSYRLDGLAANTHRGTMLPHVHRGAASPAKQDMQARSQDWPTPPHATGMTAAFNELAII